MAGVTPPRPFTTGLPCRAAQIIASGDRWGLEGRARRQCIQRRVDRRHARGMSRSVAPGESTGQADAEGKEADDDVVPRSAAAKPSPARTQTQKRPTAAKE